MKTKLKLWWIRQNQKLTAMDIKECEAHISELRGQLSSLLDRERKLICDEFELTSRKPHAA